MKLLSGTAIFLFILCIPFIIWFFQDDTTLQVAVIDKTVPEENYREHQSIHWLLNHYQYTQSDGSAYDYTSDYYGFQPDDEAESYEIAELPADYSGTDLIYAADTYGVHREDLAWTSDEEEEDEESSLIYGGWEEEEWQAVEQAVRSTNTDLVMEFNTFASPTSADIRNDILELLDLEWDGWTGRFFHDLSTEAGEVSSWMVERYESNNETWDYSGSGFAFVQEFNEEVAVLPSSDTYFEDEDITVSFTERGQEMFSLEESTAFAYWFDIVTPRNEEQVLGSYDWDLTEEGEDLLASHDIPAEFPAVLHKEESGSDIYYFAGDFSDIEDTPRFHQYTGYAALTSMFRPEFLFPDSSFFWGTVRPMLDVIFAEAAREDEPLEPSRVQALENDLSYPSRMQEDDMEIFEDGEWKTLPIKGVNLGMAKPGHFPGDAAITRDEYRRWFEMIGEMNVNTIRNYTLHPPAFYEEFLAYNEQAEDPIYLMHGVWIDEYPLEETLDAFTPSIVEEFDGEIQMLVDVIHGDASVEPEQGHASGEYHADISPYVTAWIIGIEWYPVMVDNMLQEYPDLGDYEGDYVYTEGAAPMEYWLAERLDKLFTYEKEEYSSMRPLSFTNWVTTDNLDHPAEPSEEEDMAEVNPNHIFMAQEAEETGTFASYHVYPYYPDFLNLEEDYLEYEDHLGNPNSYAGYLNDLQASHNMPVLIAEFGIPASRGKTHSNPYGWDQGFISETEQGEIVSYLYEAMKAEGFMGGLVFTWQDEWFKRTWNTMDYDNPYRRPFWSNAQTNEQQFGLLSFDRHKVRVNGEDDWTEGIALAENAEGPLHSLEADHDERYLYLKVEGDLEAGDELTTYFSIRPDEGISVGDIEADFRLTLEEEEGELEIAGDYDTFFFDYGNDVTSADLIPEIPELENVFHPIRLALNKEITRPDTGEIIEFEYEETGIFRHGIADPDHEDYDSLNDYVMNTDDGMIEIRIPWMLLNAKDPSLKEFTGDIWNEGLEDSITIDEIAIASELRRDGEAADTLQPEEGYSWENWEEPEYEERLKQSYYILQETFAE